MACIPFARGTTEHIMRMRKLSWSIVWIGLWVCGCEKKGGGDEGGTRGQEDRVEFKYQRSCFFGCPLEQPLLAGTRERISLSDRGDLAGLEVSSSDPELARFAVERECHCARGGDSNARVMVAEDGDCDDGWRKHCDNSVLVEALQPGEPELTLRSEEDTLIDRVELRIAEPERARFMATLPERLGATEVTDVDLAAGESAGVELTLYDDHGRELLAPEGIDWRMGDAAVATVHGFLLGGGRASWSRRWPRARPRSRSKCRASPPSSQSAWCHSELATVQSPFSTPRGALPH
jgi:hypothetical protein